ncbi:HAD-IB family hydrolase [Paenibacillus sambharensis]|uniref:HAD-IB family hydrolase n=1 Tax=Paenibacillus sambharensis TaxID=1803190 RepID=A0A2W1L6N8_9BACL|nr:HAD family hydrolase [Paenibacillus sambharensis]PZD95868.1 HAD-IB family hydrolase [Paenibacillus sambharensis]
METVKIALFDIDKTVIRHDSMFQFVKYSLRAKPWTAYRLLHIAAYTCLYKLKLMPLQKAKSAYFYAINHFREEDLERFYDTELATGIYPEALAEMEALKRQGYRILLITASPHAYMQYFSKLPAVDDVIGTNLCRVNGRYTSRIEGLNCKGKEKVARLQTYLKDHGLVIDYEQSRAYSDSLTDLPMFNLVKSRYLINRSHPGLEQLTWKM